jgi:FkbM family methyltransferase
MAMTEQDFRTSLRGRRQSWFGLKPGIKSALASSGIHPVLRASQRLLPGRSIRRLPAPAGLTEVVAEVDGERFVLLDPARCEIAKEIYWGRGRRPVPGDALALDVTTRLAREADVFLDVGAYTGVFTLAALTANPRIHAHAFEMVPAVAEGLVRNLDRNAVTDRAMVHRRGVGELGDRMTVPSGEGGSALPSFYSARLSFREGVEVEFVSLDSLVADVVNAAESGAAGEVAAGAEPELADAAESQLQTAGEADAQGPVVTMKVDVEGTENTVFAHGQEFLARFAPDILCEVLVEHARPRELEALLAPHGYSYYLVRDEELELRRRITPDPDHRDWLFTTRSPEDLAQFAPVTD